MPTTGELLNPLALCSRVEDAVRREVLMRGVLGHLSAWQITSEVEADPDWEDVQALLVPRTCRPGPRHPGSVRQPSQVCGCALPIRARIWSAVSSSTGPGRWAAPSSPFLAWWSCKSR